MEVLIAAAGNRLRRDDGFGPAVLELLRPIVIGRPGIRLLDVGTGGIELLAPLLDGCDALILLDAVEMNARPGTVRVIRARDAGLVADEDGTVDLHRAGPLTLLRMAAELDALPSAVWIVGCQPAAISEFGIGLTPAVQDALPQAVREVETILARL